MKRFEFLFGWNVIGEAKGRRKGVGSSNEDVEDEEAGFDVVLI